MSADSTASGLRCFRRGRWCLQWALFTLIVAGLSVIVGCKSTLDVSALKNPLANLGKPSLDNDRNRASIAGIMGPNERKLKQASWEKEQREAEASGGVNRIEGLAEYQAAKQLFDAGNYPAAEKAFRRLAKQRRDGGMSFSQRITKGLQTGISDPSANRFGDPVEEDALFMLAESQFQQKKYSWAQDSYDNLLERYPSSRHLDEVTRRLFTIARAWMNFPEVGEDDNVKLASAELQNTNPRRGDRSFKKPSFVNVTDRSRPLFDTTGRALQALQSIWLHDANGPLADDALMLTANYHLQTADFVEAARVYQLLREQYPDSPHFKDAYLLDSHVRLAAYEGPGYDDKSLEQSRELRETAQRLFPDLTPDQRQKLEDQLGRIHLMEVEREWHKVQFYQSKGSGYEPSIALHANVILNRYPDTPFADLARKALAEIGETQRPSRPSPLRLLTGPEKPTNSPVLAGIVRSPSPARQTARRQPDSSIAPASAPNANSKSPTPDNKPGFWQRMLTPVRQTPNLQPIDSDPQTEPEDDAAVYTLESATPGRSQL